MGGIDLAFTLFFTFPFQEEVIGDESTLNDDLSSLSDEILADNTEQKEPQNFTN